MCAIITIILFILGIMAIKKNQVFLISGQMKLASDESARLAPEVVQRVVLAEDSQAAYGHLVATEPDFTPLGHASLQDYESAVAKLRATLKGEATGWSLLVAPGIKI